MPTMDDKTRLQAVAAAMSSMLEVAQDSREEVHAAAFDAFVALLGLRNAIMRGRPLSEAIEDEGPEVAPPEPFDPSAVSGDSASGEGVADPVRPVGESS